VIAKVPITGCIAPNTFLIYAEKTHQLARTRFQFGSITF
jgi:hypothetical protein